jgi:hypothetical protein
MDQSTLVPFPGAVAGSADDVALAEIEAGVALVALGLATRVRLVAIPNLEDVAAAGLALAQASRVAFVLDRSTSGSVALTLGPRTQT